MTVKLSIITPTLNVEKTVYSCLKSLNAQTIPFEHIVIDGLSTDSTLQLIKDQSPQSHIVSEKDNGLYDALNKGIRMATGDVVGILPADDFFVNDQVLARIAEVFKDPAVDACYADLLYVTERCEARGVRYDNSKTRDKDSEFRVVRYWRSGHYDPNRFYWGWMVPHPTLFVRKSVYEKFGLFNLDLGTAADYELMLRFMLKQGIAAKYIPEVLVKMRTGGVSNATINNRMQANRMDRKAWDVNGLKPHPWTLLLKPIRKLPQWFFKG